MRSFCKSGIRERFTRTAKLSLVLPVSIWLMWVVEIPTFSARASCDRALIFLNFRIRCPIV